MNGLVGMGVLGLMSLVSYGIVKGFIRLFRNKRWFKRMVYELFEMRI